MINVNQLPALVKLIPRDQLEILRSNGDLKGWEISPQRGTPYAMARRIFLSPLGLPCIQPPWGKLVAVNLANGTLLWDMPLGTLADLAPAIVPNFKWGAPNIGGALMTKSGLVVIGAVAEHVLRIFDSQSGAELWTYDLPTAAISTPMSYEINGSQYIVISVGGHDGLEMGRGDYLMAFRLH